MNLPRWAVLVPDLSPNTWKAEADRSLQFEASLVDIVSARTASNLQRETLSWKPQNT